MGSGCGAVGRAVASKTRGPGFKNSHRQLLLNIYLLITVCRKEENKEKRGRDLPIFKKEKKKWRRRKRRNWKRIERMKKKI